MNNTVSNDFKRNSNLLKKKMLGFVIPVMLQSAAFKISNLVDAFMVSKFLGSDDLVVLNVADITDYFTDIPHLIFGTGGVIIAGALLGDGKKKDADGIFSSSILGCAILGFLIAVLSFFSDPLARLMLGMSDPNLTNSLADYLRINFLISAIVVVILCLSKFATMEGLPKLSALFYTVSNIINLILDYFIFNYTNLGIKGAAISTGMGYVLGGSVLLGYYFSKKRSLRFVPVKDLKFSQIVSSFKAGSSEIIDVLLETGMDGFRARIIMTTFGTVGMLFMTIQSNILTIISFFVNPFISQMKLMTSVLFAEKDYYGTKDMTNTIKKYSLTAVCIISIVFAIWPGLILDFFSITENRDILCMIIRISCIAFPLDILVSFYWSYYESIQKNRITNLISFTNNRILETIIIFIVCMFTLANNGKADIKVMPVVGIVDSLVAFILVFVIVKVICREKNMLIMDPEDIPKSLDISLSAEEINASQVSEYISDFCKEHGVSQKHSDFLGILGEDMIVSIIEFRKDRQGTVDLNLNLLQKEAVMRVRDDGIPYNPLEYEHEDKELFDSFDMVRKVAKEIKYTRVMDLNNTILTMDIDRNI